MFYKSYPTLSEVLENRVTLSRVDLINMETIQYPNLRLIAGPLKKGWLIDNNFHMFLVLIRAIY